MLNVVMLNYHYQRNSPTKFSYSLLLYTVYMISEVHVNLSTATLEPLSIMGCNISLAFNLVLLMYLQRIVPWFPGYP